MTQWPTPSGSGDDERTEVMPIPPAAPPPFGSPDVKPASATPESDPTEALPFVTPDTEATTALPMMEDDSHKTKALPTLVSPPPTQSQWITPGHSGSTPTAEIPPPPPPLAIGSPKAPPGIPDDDLRASDTWAWQMSRTQNRASTDVGLLLLRLFSLPLVLHSIRQLLTFGEFVAQIRSSPVGAVAPEAIAIAVIIAQTILPVLLALGFGTRVVAALQALLMGGIYAVWVLSGSSIVDPATGALAGETTLAYAALALPLVLTGPGRFSLDHGLTAERRERTVHRRVEKKNRHQNG